MNLSLKYHIIILSIATFTMSCSDTKNLTSSSNKGVITSATLFNLRPISKSEYTISKDEIKIIYNEDTEKTDSGNAILWELINKEIKTLNLEEFENYSAATDAIEYDGSLQLIELNINGRIYKSKKFNYGQPPAELQRLYLLLETLIK